MNISNYPKNIFENVYHVFLDIFPHINTEKLVICGGFAIRGHLNTEHEKTSINDIDLLLDSLEDIKPSVMNSFYIYHFHDYTGRNNKYDFYFSLVHKSTSIKVDIFSYKPYVPFDPITNEILGKKVKVRNAECQLSTKIIETWGIFNGDSVVKQWASDIKDLYSIANLKRCDDYLIKRGHKISTEESVKMILDKISSDPTTTKVKSDKRTAYECEMCENKYGFVVEPMEKIYKILGYLE